MTPFKFTLCKCCTITGHLKSGVVFKLQLRVGHSDAGIAGRNVRLRYAIVVHRHLGHFRFSDDGDRLSAGVLRTPYYIVLRGTPRRSRQYITNRSDALTIFNGVTFIVSGVEVQSSGEAHGIRYFHHQDGELPRQQILNKISKFSVWKE